ncbi:MAG: substrate-binding domain-containing protein, partial [Planctomycetales bacterium]|nr:substrate-binding domain-containing protein [Planctomycetales bacterium]
MKHAWAPVAVVLLAVAAAWWLMLPRDQPSVRVLCAVVMHRPMERIARQYEAETGVRVELAYGGSKTLLEQL